MNYSHETLVAYLPRALWLAADFSALERCLSSVLPEIKNASLSVGQISVSKKKSVPFGALRWNEKGFAKWLHDAPGNEDKSQDWEFYDLEACTPKPSEWDMHGAGPDLFVALANYKRGVRTDTSDVACLLQVSIGQCKEEGGNEAASEKLDKIRDCITPARSFRRNWKWAPFSPGGSIRNVFLKDFAKGRRVALDALTERVLEHGWRVE